MASYGGVTPRQQDDFRQATQRTDNSQTRVDNYNGFMTHREIEPHTSNQKSLSLEYGKSITLLRNGDEFYKGQKVVINSRKYRYFDVFLDDLSDTMQARFGAVRNIHTPVHGHKVKSLDQFEDGKTYVASGAGRFVKLNYLDISDGKRVRPNRLPTLNRPTDYSNIQVAQYDKPGNILIFVYKNGDVMSPPSKVLLAKNTLSSYDAVLNEITFKVQLLNGAVLKLYTMEGELVTTPAQLISGHGYVAANKERFKRVEYFSPQDFNNHTSPRNARKINFNNEQQIIPLVVKKMNLNSQPISHNSSNPSTSGKSTFSYPGKPYTGWHKEGTRREGSLPPVIGPKPNRGQQQNVKPINSRLDVDRDDGGIFKAKQKTTNNAKTIQDSKDMYIDMPVDYRRPKQVIDEEINDNRRQVPQNIVAKANSKQPPQQNNNNNNSLPPVPPKQSYDHADDNLLFNSINMSDIPTIDSSTSSNDNERVNYKIEYNQYYVQEEEHDTDRTFTNEELPANLTRTIENLDDNLEATYDIHPVIDSNEDNRSDVHENDENQVTPVNNPFVFAAYDEQETEIKELVNDLGELIEQETNNSQESGQKEQEIDFETNAVVEELVVKVESLSRRCSCSSQNTSTN